MTTSNVTVDGVDVALTTYGAGQPFLLLHGGAGPQSVTAFAELFARLNCASHIEEMGRDAPRYPTLFAKYDGALIGAHDPIVLPAVSDRMDSTPARC